jgi:glutamine amidotransferase-like uncharacterized protein
MAEPISVGLFTDAKATDPPSCDAALAALSTKSADIKATRLSADDIKSGALSKYQVLVLPGGTANGIAKALGTDGGARVTEFARNGGGVIGICAGAYYIAEGWSPETKAVELINAKTFDDKHWARGQGFIAVEVAAPGDKPGGLLPLDQQPKPAITPEPRRKSPRGPAASARRQVNPEEDNDDGSPVIPDNGSPGVTSRTLYFQNGPLFVPGAAAGAPAYTPLVKYVTDLAAPGAPKGMMATRDAIIAASFGNGRVVAFGPHPERTPGQEYWLSNAVKWVAGRGTDPSPQPTVQSVLEGNRTLRIAVYRDSAPSPKGAHLLAGIVRENLGARTDIITSESVKALRFEDYDAVMFPGGSGKRIALSMGPEAVERFRNYVLNGGGTVGVCAGAYFLTESPRNGPKGADILNAKVFDRANWARGQHHSVLQILPPGAPSAHTNPTPIDADGTPATIKPLLSDAASSRTVRYNQGPMLVPNQRPDQPPYTPLVRFASDAAKAGAPTGMMAGRDAVIAAPAGKGRAVAISPHPETPPKGENANISELRYWIANSVRWVTEKDFQGPITYSTVLEGQR